MTKWILSAILCGLCGITPASADDASVIRCRVVESVAVPSQVRTDILLGEQTIFPQRGYIFLKVKLELNNTGRGTAVFSAKGLSIVDKRGRRLERKTFELVAVGDVVKSPDAKKATFETTRDGVRIHGTLLPIRSTGSTVEWELPGLTKYEDTLLFAIPEKAAEPKLVIDERKPTKP